MKKIVLGLAMAAVAMVNVAATAAKAPKQTSNSDKPLIVLVHGAFADGSSWNGVIGILRRDGYVAIAAANPLRGVNSDGKYISSLVGQLKSPVVLVGHSYGGSVITEAANGHANVKALVYVSAFAPDTGESAGDLAGRFPGSTLAQALAPPIALTGGGRDLYILPQEFHAQFAADVPAAQAALMAATQRPVIEAALGEKAGQAAWKTIPSWYIYGTADRNIPPAAMAFMATRAHAKNVVVIKGASHVAMVSHPDAVARLIEKAASAQ